MSQTPTVIILAGGANSRFWPLREKSLYPFMGVSLLEKQLQVYQSVGLRKAVVVANPGNRDMIAEAMQNSATGFEYDVVVQDEPLGMGHAILQAEPFLKNYPPIYITQVNDVVLPQLHESMLAAYQKGKATSLLAGYQVEKYFPGGYLVVDGDSRISSIIEKPGAGNEPSDLVNIVAHIHANSRILFQMIHHLYEEGHQSDDHYEVAMSVMMQEMYFECVRYRGPWYPIKYPWHVLDVTRFYLDQISEQQIHPDARIFGNVLISGNVIIEAGAKIFHGASVVGPAYIGPNAIVGNGALVRESMVGGGSVVGHISEVARSYLGQRVNLHRAVVLDSVFEDEVNFSAGCITANLRIDHGGVKSTVKGDRLNTGRDKLGAIMGTGAFIGIQSGTMPGVKIGAGAEVGAFTNVTQDLREGERLYASQSVTKVAASGRSQE